MPFLHQLHWLWAPERITFQLAVLVYCCLHGLAPSYLVTELYRVTDVNPAISLVGGTDRPTDVAQLHWRPLLSCCDCTHLEQSSAICNRVSISTDFSDEIENWAVSEILHDCQSSVTQYFVTWPWSFFCSCHDNGNLFTDWRICWRWSQLKPVWCGVSLTLYVCWSRNTFHELNIC